MTRACTGRLKGPESAAETVASRPFQSMSASTVNAPTSAIASAKRSSFALSVTLAPAPLRRVLNSALSQSAPRSSGRSASAATGSKSGACSDSRPVAPSPNRVASPVRFAPARNRLIPLKDVAPSFVVMRKGASSRSSVSSNFADKLRTVAFKGWVALICAAEASESASPDVSPP